MEDQNQNPEMPGNQERGSSGQSLGVASLITAIITFVLAVIPCVGLMAVIPGIITIVLASVGLSRSSGNDSRRGLLVAGLVIGIVATLISISQIYVAGEIFRKSGKWPTKIEKMVDEIQKEIDKAIEEASVDIRIENGDNNADISPASGKTARERTLEELETGKSSLSDTLSSP
ncbi:MAG TPA: DUF4190 domain-containing protein [Bacteroidales bacterium]|jgi:hypothetical protein|nr:DUF4190 domain-containing protein [Bacteroidales bacterium]HOS71034.1 DUF4190 domain-containing protein [Bacteroidales bacterium]HQH25616.1 DUF4190 domain-containing protein [Bacteroidales bacterium]HQJ82831.1 DUF4190 domain-containing protein [Bacteroidales bacterium]